MLLILSAAGSWPGACHNSEHDSHMETEVQGDQGAHPQFRDSKVAAHTGSSVSGFGSSCGLSLPTSKSHDAICITPVQGFPVRPLNLDFLVNHLIDHTFMPGPVLGVGGCGAGEERDKSRHCCLSARSHIALRERMCLQMYVYLVQGEEKPQFGITKPGCLSQISAPRCP